MKAGKILLGLIVAIGALAFLSVIIVKEVNKQLYYNLVIQKEL